MHPSDVTALKKATACITKRSAARKVQLTKEEKDRRSEERTDSGKEVVNHEYV